MLAKMKILLGITDTSKDDLLTLLLSDAEQFALNYTHQTDVTILEPIIIKMAIISFNRLGSEGATSESYSGVSYSYESDYPADIYKQLNVHRRIRVV